MVSAFAMMQLGRMSLETAALPVWQSRHVHGSLCWSVTAVLYAVPVTLPVTATVPVTVTVTVTTRVTVTVAVTVTIQITVTAPIIISCA